jgi:hypothetical protein
VISPQNASPPRKLSHLKIATLASIVMLSPTGPAGAQVLAPPLLPGQQAIAERLVRALQDKDVDAYQSLLSDDLVVIVNGKILHNSRKSWLDDFGKMLSTRGVIFEVKSQFASTGRILEVEYFNSAGSWGSGPPGHCCWSYDAVAYDIRDGKIFRISKLNGGDTELKISPSPSESPQAR